MYVKIYQYNIQKDKEEEYLYMQQKATAIYERYLDVHIMFLKSQEDVTKWVEIARYKDEEDYIKSINIITHEKEIKELFALFQTFLVADKSEVQEENFIERIVKKM
ncbi:hypothetical protein [Psychrobacillus sp. FJAT-21963]|uniref:hypothetical protein n=1 Tax=Psychrobacillus sp. FJAT-21963 TaxID=1712028 RepID=UPI0006FD594A|nr:hypothetical protein [Psychrobacillus sp. FJAT-21963]KQL34349.1 hypothetical protein AN959_15205 [Psychrobacillus sp. FJAT-21963]